MTARTVIWLAPSSMGDSAPWGGTGGGGGDIGSGNDIIDNDEAVLH